MSTHHFRADGEALTLSWSREPRDLLAFGELVRERYGVSGYFADPVARPTVEALMNGWDGCVILSRREGDVLAGCALAVERPGRSLQAMSTFSPQLSLSAGPRVEIGRLVSSRANKPRVDLPLLLDGCTRWFSEFAPAEDRHVVCALHARLFLLFDRMELPLRRCRFERSTLTGVISPLLAQCEPVEILWSEVNAAIQRFLPAPQPD